MNHCIRSRLGSQKGMNDGEPMDQKSSRGLSAIDGFDARALESILEFYLSAGVTDGVEDAPVNAFELSESLAHARGRQSSQLQNAEVGRRDEPVQKGRTPADVLAAAKAVEAPPAAARAKASAAAIPGEEAVMAARSAARAAQTLEELHEALSRFEGCNLRLTARNLVFSAGSSQARLMLIGDAPGREEDNQGAPFVGPSGVLLQRMLAAIGVDKSSCYVANVVPWRPPGDRTPSPQENEICKPFLERQIELVGPEVIAFLGGAPARVLTGVQDGVMRIRGKWISYAVGGRKVKAITTLHPDYLLRNPEQKRLAWTDLRLISKELASPSA